MKRQFFLIVSTLCLLIFVLPNFGYGQKGEKTLDQNFTWDGESEEKTIYLNVEEGTDKLQMDFKGEIKEGLFYLAAYDPKGNKMGGFRLICSDEELSDVHVHVYEPDGEEGHHHHHHVIDETGVDVTIRIDSNGGDKTKDKAKSKKKSKSKNKNKSKSRTEVVNEYSSSSSSASSKSSKGVMKKSIWKPEIGTWKFILKAEKVKGTLSAVVRQF